MSSRNQPVEIKDVMVKLGGGILFLLLSTFLIEVILEIDMANQCRLHYNDGVGSVTSVFGIPVEGEREFVECIQYNESVSEITVKDPNDKDKEMIIGRTFTITNTCSGNGISPQCKTVMWRYSWTEAVGLPYTPGPHCNPDVDKTCLGKKRYHAQDKPIPMIIFALNAYLLIVGMITFLMSGYKLMLYVKQAPK